MYVQGCIRGETSQIRAVPVEHRKVHSQMDYIFKILFSMSSVSSIFVARQDLQTGVFLLWKAAVRMIYLPENCGGTRPCLGLGIAGQGIMDGTGGSRGDSGQGAELSGSNYSAETVIPFPKI